jgi:hypothetical protein
MQRDYKNIIFTAHALHRLKLRCITQDMIVTALKQPDKKELESDGDTKFIKVINNRNLHVVSAYLPDEKKWLVKSAWVRGEEDPQPIWLRLLLLPFRMLRGLFRQKARKR